MTGDRNLIDAGKGFVDDLTASARDNPVAAALIGVGFLWMLVGRTNVSRLGQKVPELATSAGETALSVAQNAAKGVEAGLSATVEGAGDATSRISNAVARRDESSESQAPKRASAGSSLPKVNDVLSQAGESISSAVRSSTASGREYATSLQKNVSETLERQPLLLGALGLAIGAGIATSFATSAAEKNLMGGSSQAAKDNITDLAKETAEIVRTRAEDALHGVKEEARRRGFTADAAEMAAHRIAEKVKGVAGAAQDSIKARVS